MWLNITLRRHILLTEGRNMFTNLQMAKNRNPRKNIISLNELIGYAELTDSNKIWPEHSLLASRNKRVSGISSILDISLVTAANATKMALPNSKYI